LRNVVVLCSIRRRTAVLSLDKKSQTQALDRTQPGFPMKRVSGKRLIGRWAGLLAVVLFIGSPLVQESSARVMTGRREHHVGVHRVLSSNPGWHWYANSLYVYARNPMASLGLAPPALRLDSLKALIVHKELR
jgi:hypothetical protein